MDSISDGDCIIRLPPVILAQPQRGKARDSVKSDAEEAFAFQIRVLGIVPPEREYRFLLTRRWRFDFAWPRQMIAIEIEGGQYVKGRGRLVGRGSRIFYLDSHSQDLIQKL